MRKLRVILVDDFQDIHQGIKDLFNNSSLIEITETYTCPKKFLQTEPSLNYDICLLDIVMPEIDGLAVARKINKPIIFITGAEEKLTEALALSPIDIITKPFTADRLNKVVEKAYKLLRDVVPQKDFELFNVAEAKGKTKLRPSDILFVTLDKLNYRNKIAYFKDGRKFTLMRYSLKELLKLSPMLIQVNKAELVSLESVHAIECDKITLMDFYQKGKYMEVTLAYRYAKGFTNNFT